MRDWPRTALVAAPRWSGTDAINQVRPSAENLDVPGEPVSQQPPVGRLATVWPRAGNEGSLR
jgi:hypothetical protein